VTPYCCTIWFSGVVGHAEARCEVSRAVLQAVVCSSCLIASPRTLMNNKKRVVGGTREAIGFHPKPQEYQKLRFVTVFLCRCVPVLAFDAR
jgi:hypothetical protein